MMMAVMRQCPVSWSPYPNFLGRTSQATRKPQVLKPLCFSFSSQEEAANELVKKLPKDIIFVQGLGPNHFKEKASLKFLPTVFVAANALMLATPLHALAETCEADKSVFNMPLLLFVSLVGATVGGLLARQRRGELQRLNEQLRQINAALRRQAKIESYAPTLSYAPVGRITETEVIVDPRKEELISRLKNGKNFLRNQEPQKAFSEFKTALDLAQNLKDPIEEKKAARGLGASLQRQGKFREAIKYHSLVLEISKKEGEESGNTEAYGAIADCYTELGDLERAAKYYDQYIARKNQAINDAGGDCIYLLMLPPTRIVEIVVAWRKAHNSGEFGRFAPALLVGGAFGPFLEMSISKS